MGLEKETFKVCTALVSDQRQERIPIALLIHFLWIFGYVLNFKAQYPSSHQQKEIHLIICT